MSVKATGSTGSQSHQDYLDMLKRVVENPNPTDAEIKSAKHSYESHKNAQLRGAKEPQKLFTKKELDLLEKFDAIQRDKIKEQWAFSAPVRNLFVKDDKNAGTAPVMGSTNPNATSAQADIKKVNDDFDALQGEKDAVRKAPPAGAAAASGPNPDTELFLRTIAESDASLAAAIMKPVAAGQKLKTAEKFEDILTAKMEAKDGLEAFRKNPLVKDAMAVLTDNPGDLSKETRKAVRDKMEAFNKEAEKTGAPKKSVKDIYEELRQEMAGNLQKVRPEIMGKAQDALSIDPEAAKGLNPEQQKTVAEHNALLGSAMDKINKGAEKTLTPDEMAAMAIGNDTDQLLRKKGLATPGGPDAPEPQDLAGKMAALKESNHGLYSVITDMQNSRTAYYRTADRTYNEILSLLNSGMPIELVVMLVMARMAEKSEEKLKLKLKEAAAIEAVERHNNQAAEAAKAAGKEPPPPVDPTQYGVPGASSTTFMQEVQFYQQQYMQMLQALSAVIRQVQDMIMTPIRNIR